ncbi:two-component system sensor histidine kinase CreC [Megalodesulfovibrio paquesii]
MSLRRKLFLALTFLTGLSLVFLLDIVLDELKPAMRRTVEETLIDTSVMLAELARDDMAAGQLEDGRLVAALTRYTTRQPDAVVWGVRKDRTDHRVYITDARGIVRFDSDGGQDVGKDYSQWNDVHLTLQGRYGARTSPQHPDTGAVMYVAAPVLAGNGTLLGVLSVGKPAASIEPHFAATRARLLRAGVLLFGAAVLLSLVLAWWHGRDVIRLGRYAAAVAQGRRTALPSLRTKEIRQLGGLVETMRTELEGRAHVERTVLALAHELKSPLTAVTAAMELLEDPAMPEIDRVRFLEQVRRESERMGRIIERLLTLARLEARPALREPEAMDLAAIARGVLQERHWLVAAREIRVDDQLPPALPMLGEAQLARQALDVLLENALEFTPRGGGIRLEGGVEQGMVALRIHNDGPAIPEYARDRLFERFYSLPRPDTGRKSTGLGLALAQEAAALHGGAIAVENDPAGGVMAVLRLPLG